MAACSRSRIPKRRSTIWRCATPRRNSRWRSILPPPAVVFAVCSDRWRRPLECCSRWAVAALRPRSGAVHVRHRTPARAVSVASIAIILIFVLWAPFSGAGNFYSYTSTIGTLTLILIYIGVGGAEMVEAQRERRPLWVMVCSLGPLLLLWVLYRNLYPVPEFPNNLWPYVTFVWIIASWAVIRARPALTVEYER